MARRLPSLPIIVRQQLDRKKHEIPRETYKYEDENKNLREKPPAETPVLRDAPVSPISKTFLDSVNHQIQQIKFHQAKERVMFGSRGEPGCVPLHGSIVVGVAIIRTFFFTVLPLNELQN